MAKVKDKDAATKAERASTKATSPGLYIARQAHIDEVDKLAAKLETKWGCGRLRLLVGPELREKLDRQRYLFNQAIWYGELEDVRREAERMCNAWRFLDNEATALKLPPADERSLEVTLNDGTVVVICADPSAVAAQVLDERRKQIWTLDEIGRVLDAFPALSKAKHTFPGAEVIQARRRVSDALQGLADSEAPIDQPFARDAIPF
jgi:hypothetical protein